MRFPRLRGTGQEETSSPACCWGQKGHQCNRGRATAVLSGEGREGLGTGALHPPGFSVPQDLAGPGVLSSLTGALG